MKYLVVGTKQGLDWPALDLPDTITQRRETEIALSISIFKQNRSYRSEHSALSGVTALMSALLRGSQTKRRQRQEGRRDL